MKKYPFLSVLLLLFISQLSFTQTIVFTGNGGDDNWETPTNWNLNRVPNSTDDVTFADNQIVIINTDTEIRSLVVELSHLLEIKAALTIKSGHPQTGVGLHNRGVIVVENNAILFIQDIGKTGILNENNITVSENGNIRFVSDLGFAHYDNAAIDNRGEIVNSGDITLNQEFDDPSDDNVNPEIALLNSGIIRNFDFFSLDDIMINEEGGQIFNSGDFDIEVAVFAFSADEAINRGTITNQDGGEIEINNLHNDGQIITETNSTFSGGFLLNRKQIDNGGTLRFQTIEQKNKDTELTNTGTLEVEGDFRIGADTEVDNQNICKIEPNPEVAQVEGNGVNLSGTLNNSGTIAFRVGTLTVDFSGKLTNSGTANFGENGIFFLLIINAGTIENQTGGTMNIGSISAGQNADENRPFWLHNLPTATFKNAGDILSANQNAVLSYPDTVIFNQGIFENQLGGDIQLHHPDGMNVGIFNQNNFTNLGFITIGKVNQAVGKGVVNLSTFRNESPADLTIDNTGSNAILNETGATFQNVAGDIFIGQSVGVQQFGIINKGRWESELIGALTPSIIIQNTSDDALINETNADFFNNGILRIGVNGTIGRGGIFNKSSFQNLESGRIQIENYGANFPQPINGGISNNGGFINDGDIEIKNAQNQYVSLLNRTNANFSNNPCAQFASPLPFNNAGLITNSGFWESTHNGIAHTNEGNFINNGLLEDHFDSFAALGTFGNENELINNGFIANRTIAEDDDTVIEETFELGTELPISFDFAEDGQLLNASNQDIGGFNIFDNITLDNPLPIGEHELNFVAQDANNNCTSDITLFVEIDVEFSCTLTPTNATNGNNNGAITTDIQGGSSPFTFEWNTPNEVEPNTQNLSNQPPGSYIVTITDNFDKEAVCETSISMVSQSPECGSVTIHWDGGAKRDNDGNIEFDDDNNIIFVGDGASWNDPNNWNLSRVPNASDVVGGFLEVFQLPENRRRINLNVDANVKSFVVSGGTESIGLTIPSGKTLTVECRFQDGLFENSGDLIVTAGTALIGNEDFVNDGIIDVTGVGSADVILQIGQINSKTNNGIIKVNNLGRNGLLLVAGDLINNGLITLENGAQGTAGVLNKTNGRIEIDNVITAISADCENEGLIFIDEVETGIINSFQNKASGRIQIDNAEIGIHVPFQETFTNEGSIKLGSRSEGFQGSFGEGVFNEGTFINSDSLIIDGFTDTGIRNDGDFSQGANNEEVAIFINETTGTIEINGRIDNRGRPLPEIGISNVEGFFHNKNDLFIKDIQTVGIDNQGIRAGFTDVEGDEFRNDGTLTLNFIGVNHNNPAARGIHNRAHAQFVNNNEILIGTIKNNFTVGGKIKGVGIYCEMLVGFGARDKSRFINNKLIKIDNIIQGGKLNNISTGHGLLTHQRAGRESDMDTVFVNKGANTFGTGLLQIGGHKPIAKSGIFMKGGAAGIVARGINENGGNIRINQTGSHGFHAVGEGNSLAKFDNEGLFQIGDQITIEGSGMVVDDSEFNNLPNGEMTVNATIGNGIEVSSSTDQNVIRTAAFNNESNLKIGNAAAINGHGILVKTTDSTNDNQRAEFRNEEGATLEIDRCGMSGIRLVTLLDIDDGKVEFENHSLLKIGQNTPNNMLFSESGIDISSADFREFIPNTGRADLLIDRVQRHGIFIEEGDASLRGTVDIGTNQTVGKDGIHVVGSLARVFSSAVMNIKNTGNNGIDISEGSVSSGAALKIDGTFNHGIEMNNGDFFNNAQMNIDNLDGDALHLVGSDVRFDNNALLKIGEVPVGGLGVFMDSGADFNNRERLEIVGTLGNGIFNDGDFFNFGENAVVFIDNADTAIINHRNFSTTKVDAQILIEDFKVGIINERAGFPFASFNNTGIIRMRNDNPSGEDICLKNRSGGFFTNNGCARLEFFGHVENENATLRNFGFFTFEEIANAKTVTNQGTFENKGVIEDVQQRLNANSLTLNENVILHPTCIGDSNTGVLNDAVVLGSNVSFSIGAWTLNNFGNGIYDQAANTVTFDTPFPNDIVTAEFTVVNNNFPCSIQARERVDFRNLFTDLVAEAGTDQLNLCQGITQLNAKPAPFGESGVWNMLQNPDGAGKIANPSNPFSDFTGTGGQTYVLRWTINAPCGSGSDEVTISFAPDADGDGICDAEDICSEGEDDIDENENGLPDACECLDEALQVPGFPIEQSNFKTAQTITSTGRVANGDVVRFRAKNAVLLATGFQVETGGNFEARIEDCAAVLVKSEVASTAFSTTENQDVMESEVKDMPNFANLAYLVPQVQVFPNPTQTYTNIQINLTKPTITHLDLFDLQGRKVATLVQNEPLDEGTHHYQWSCDRVESGMYLVVLNGQVVSKLMVVE